ncbi:MAG: ribosome biogenesis GTPase Der [Pseudomonadales bacterium]|nr:ribosome biogenesis GTPase Der [Pseudomonadales bacterium]
MIPVIALVGRPNVGKSTLFNRLTGTRDAIVANYAGLTRDRQYGDCRHAERAFIVIDTGGINESDEGIDFKMAEQSLLAIEESDLVLLMVDARDGLTPGDQHIVDYLRKKTKPVFLVVNKVDGLDQDIALTDFYRLGFEHVFGLAASQGRGVNPLLDACLAEFPVPGEEDSVAVKSQGIRIAIAGRPNVGKSTLVNRMLGEERVVVFDMPGTTRDSVYIPFERQGRKYTLIDTAGIRKRGKTKETVEKFSVVKSLQAIQDAHVVILLLDAREGVVEQDLHLLGYVLETGRALVIALNKWDGMTEYDKDQVKKEIRRRFVFVDFAKIHFISALHGTGVGDLYKSVNNAYASASKKLVTNTLTQILERATADHAPPIMNGRRVKLRYAHAGGQNPPLIVIHGKQTEKLPDSYSRYLEKAFRKYLKLEGTPVRIELRSDENPYTRDEQSLTPQQVARKRKILKNRQGARSDS